MADSACTADRRAYSRIRIEISLKSSWCDQQSFHVEQAHIEGLAVRSGEASQKRSLAWHFSESRGYPRSSSFSARTFRKPAGNFSDHRVRWVESGTFRQSACSEDEFDKKVRSKERLLLARQRKKLERIEWEGERRVLFGGDK